MKIETSFSKRVPAHGGSQREDGRPTPLKIDRSTWRLCWVIVFGAFASGLDTSIINVGLETIQRDLSSGLGLTQWISTGYLVALAVSLPLCGWLGKKIGVGRLWLGSLAAFTLASALCAAAGDINILIISRVIQGFSAGLLIPAGQTILGQAVGPDRLGRVMGTLGIVLTAAPALGPVVGGFLLGNLSWQWLFLINIPIGIVGLSLGLKVVPRGVAASPPSFDWRGFLYVGIGLSALIYSLTMWGSRGTLEVPSVWIPLAVGILGLMSFMRRASRRDTVMDLRLYRNRLYSRASGATALSGAVMFAAGLLFPLYFQLLWHKSTEETGLLLVAFSVGTAAMLPISGKLVDRFGGGIVSVTGNFLTVVATLAFSTLGSSASLLTVEVMLVLLGMAVSLTGIPATVAAFKTVQMDQLPDATAQISIMLRSGGALGGAVIAVTLSRLLPTGTEHAFLVTFWWLSALTVLSLMWSIWFWRAESSSRQ